MKRLWYRLSKETDEAAELLSQVLVVGKRHLKLGLKMLPRDPDRAYIQINTSWMDNRPGQNTGASAPVADSYSLKVRGDITHERSETMGLPELTFFPEKGC